MALFQANEVANLVLSLAAVLIAILLFRRERIPGFLPVYAALGLIICSNIFTVVEGAVWHAGFNLLEHLCYLFAGMLFLYASLRMRGGVGE